MKIVNLASGSKANCSFVGYKNTKLLIDDGLSERTLKQRLNEIDESISSINAVLITHEHSDHISGLKALSKYKDIKIYMHKNLAKSSYIDSLSIKNTIEIFDTDTSFMIGDIEVTAFDTSHDAIAPVGFVLKAAGSKAKVGFVTDLGEVTEGVKTALKGSKIVFIESNHDISMLNGGNYPWQVKKRILGIKGHLSNEQSLELAKFLYQNGTKCFVLSHLSQNNNREEIAYQNYVNYFNEIGCTLEKDVFIRLSFQNKHGNYFSLKEEFYGE